MDIDRIPSPQPAQWQYGFDANGEATATYPGNIIGTVLGALSYIAGVVGDGHHNDQPAIQFALNIASGAVFLPAGKFLLDAPLVIPSNVSLFGMGPEASSLIVNFDGQNVIQVGDGVSNPNDVTIAALSMTANSQMTSGVMIAFKNGYNLTAFNVRMDNNVYQGFALDGGAQQYIYNIDRCIVNSATEQGCLVGATQGVSSVQGLTISNTVFSVAGDAIIVVNGSGLVMENVESLGCNTGFVTYPGAGQAAQYIQASNCRADTCKDSGIKLYTNGGMVNNVGFSECWSSSNGTTTHGHGLDVSQGGGTVKDVKWMGGTVKNNQGNGVNLNGCTDFRMVGAQCASNSQQASAQHPNIAIGATAVNTMLVACNFGADDDVANLASYGVNVSAGVATLRVSTCNLGGNVTGPVNDASGQTTNIFRDNLGYVTQSSGTVEVVSGTSSAVYMHNMGVTPLVSDCVLTALSQAIPATLTSTWVSAISATTVTIDTNAQATSNYFVGIQIRSKGC